MWLFPAGPFDGVIIQFTRSPTPSAVVPVLVQDVLFSLMVHAGLTDDPPWRSVIAQD